MRGRAAFIDDKHVLLIRQYRYPARENHRWEMPTGGIHAHEAPEAAAQRELMEEIGYRATELTWISSFHTSKSVCEETAHLYVGRDLVAATSRPDDTEFFEQAIFAFDAVLQMVLTSEIRDAMTMLAVLHAARLRDH
jgi:ADP-ribose pyrophosphatase